MVVRELITSWGFDVDDQAIKNADKFVNKLRKGADDANVAIEKIGEKVRGTGAKLTAFLSAPIIALGLTMKNAASDAEETQAKFEAVFKDLAGQTRKWAEDTAKALGRSKFAMMGYLSTLQDTFVPLGFARDHAADMSKQLTTLAFDLAAFNNQADADVINNLTSAMVGNHEAVRSYGIIITEATLNQELLNMGVAGGTKNATEQQKAMARLNIIMKSSSDAMGTASREAMELSGREKALQSATLDMRIEWGMRLLPIARKLTNLLIKLTDWFAKLSDGTKDTILVMAGLVAVLGPTLLLLGAFAPIVSGVMKFVKALKLLNVVMIKTAVKAVLMQLAFLAVPLLILAAIAALILFVEDIWGWVNGSQSAIGQLLGSFEDFKNKIKEWLGPDLVNAISATFDTVVEIIKAVPGAVVDAAKLAWSVFDRIFVEPVRAALRLFGIGGQDATVTGMVAGGTPAQTVQQSAASNRSNNLTSNINVTVPQGTPEEQANAIAAVAEQAIKKAFNEAVDSSASEFPEYE